MSCRKVRIAEIRAHLRPIPRNGCQITRELMSLHAKTQRKDDKKPSRFAAILLAATILFHGAQARAFDSSGYYGGTAIEILVTGDTTPILQNDNADSKLVTIYALSLAGRLQFLWNDRLTEEFGGLAFIKVALVAHSAGLETEALNNLLKPGSLDADIFAAQHDFDSETAQNLLATLAALVAI